MENKKPLIISGIVLAVVAIVIIISTSEGNFTGFAVTNPIKVCEEVKVPYETQEAYQEKEPYQAIEEYQVPLKYEVISADKGTTLHGFDVWAKNDVVVRNIDSETGTFTVTQTFKTLNKQGQTKKSSKSIMSREMKTFHEEFDIDLGEDFNVDYTVTPSKKTLMRTVTKYRTITKYKTVTKYKIEEKCT